MDIKLVNIDEVKPYNKNPRKNLNVEKVAISIKEFGFQQPIVVDKSMTVVVGHTRLEASRQLELKQVPVLIADMSAEKIKAYRIADNKTNEGSEWDFPLLNAEFGDLLDVNYDLEKLGFDNQELESLITYTNDDTVDVVDQNEVAGAEANYIIQYNVIFDNKEQQESWFQFIKRLKEIYPHHETIGQRLIEYIRNNEHG
jgi:ParB-like chromosome segregation protein Spo0J